jgi:UDP-N-acetylmuramate dehydrogenase
MIDEAGLKGARVGGAMVSEKHAGFVINYDNATSADILNLIDHVKKVILEKEGLHIQCEVRVIQ